MACIIDQGVFRMRGISKDKVEEWREATPDWNKSIPEVYHRRDKLFPVRVTLVPGEGEDPLGYLLIGPRPDGSVISQDEQKAIKEVAEPIARAVKNVIKRVAYQRRLESLIESNSRQLSDLEARLIDSSLSTVPSSQRA